MRAIATADAFNRSQNVEPEDYSKDIGKSIESKQEYLA